MIEPCMSIVAACLPTLRPLLKSQLSLRSLARSLQSHILGRNNSGGGGYSEDSSHMSNHRRNDIPAEDKSHGPWTQLPERNGAVACRDDIELATSHSEEWGPRSDRRVQVGYVRESQTKRNTDSTRNIYVERSVTSKSEER